MHRYLSENIEKDLKKKAILLSGPRQVGKTTLARELLGGNGAYLNYDVVGDRRAILAKAWRRDSPCLVLDEVHKARKWKNFLKGIIDEFHNQPPLIVTGSARLEVFRKAGDALTGRTFIYHLHPIDVAEAAAMLPEHTADDHLDHLLETGGFPESFFHPEDAPRLLRDRLSTVLRDDLRDLSAISDVKSLEILIELLRERVGGQAIYSNLAGDLSVSGPTVKSWIELLEHLCLVFLIRPYSRGFAKSIRKEPKIYFFDCAAAKNGHAAKLENLVACALLKWCDYEADTKGRSLQLYYFRDSADHEVDFIVTESRQVLACIEVKSGDDTPAPALRYLAQRMQPRHALQLVQTLGDERDYGPIKIRRLASWLGKLPFDAEG